MPAIDSVFGYPEPRRNPQGSLVRVIILGAILSAPAFAQYNQTLPWNYSVGNSSSFSAYLNGQLQLSGAVTGTSVVAQSAAGGAILGYQKDIVTASASAAAYLTGDSSAHVSLKVLGFSAYSYDSAGSAPLTKADTYKKGFDVQESGKFPVGPFEVHVTIGVRGTASVSYSIGLKSGGASASVTPSLNATTYGMAGLGDGYFVEVGVGTNLTLVDDSLPITATAQLSPNYFAAPPAWGVKWDFDITNKLNLLSGNIFLYATLDWFFGKDTWKTTIFSWPGFQINKTLFHDGGWTSVDIPLPQLSTLDPPSVNAGSGDLTLTLNGSGFNSGSTISWNGSPLSASYLSGSQLRTSVPASYFFNPAIANVTVQNPGLLGGTSNSLPLHIVVPPPFVTRLNPGAATAGGPNFTLTVDGSWLVAGSTVMWNSTPLITTRISDFRLTAIVPAALASSPGTAQLAVSQPAPYNQSSNILTLPIFAPQPVVSSTRPFRVWPGGADLTVRVLGTGFLPTGSVYWSGARLQTTYVSAVELDALVPASFVSQSVIAAIDVVNPTSSPSNAVPFTVAPTTYTAIELPRISGYGSIVPVALNNIGQIVGRAEQASSGQAYSQRGFLWTESSGITDLGTIGIRSTCNGGPPDPSRCPSFLVPFGLNDIGQVVGYASNSTSAELGAFVYTNGVLNSLPGLLQAWAINGSGTIAGNDWSLNALFIQNNHLAPIGLTGYPAAINTNGDIVGSSYPEDAPFLWRAGILSLLPRNDGKQDWARSINDYGVVVGYEDAVSLDQQRAIVWRDGVESFLNIPNGRRALDINNSGDIVGDSRADVPGSWHGWLFSQGNYYDLNSLLSNKPNGRIFSAVSISDIGQIAAVIVHPDNTTGAVLLKPDPASDNLPIPTAVRLSTLQIAPRPAADSILTVTGAQPSSVLKGSQAQTVSLAGTGFTAGMIAYWNGSPLNTVYISNTAAIASVPSALLIAAGYATVVVVNPGGQSSNAIAITIANPVPVGINLAPAQTVAGGSLGSIAVTGAGFVPGSVIYWNGSPLATAYQSSTQLTAVVAAGLITNPATAAITVVNPGPGGGASNVLLFRINPPAPVLTNLNQSSTVAGAPGFTLTLSGSGFDQTSMVLWNNTPLQTTFVSPTTLTAQVSASYLAAPGTPSVQVTDTIPSSWSSRSIQFIITYPSPQLTSLSPNSVQAGTGDLTLAVNGAGFVDGSQVYLNGDPLTTTYVSGSQLNAAVTAGDAAVAGTSQITVVNPQPSTSPQSGPLTFTVTAPPMIQDVTPAMSRQGSVPIVITLRGQGFTGQSVATWNDSPIPTTIISGTQLSATIPAVNLAVPGTFPIRVVQQTTGGGRSRAVSFSVNSTPPPVPTITGLTPSSIMAGSDHFGLSINGTGFLSTTTGLWNGAPLPTTFISPTQVIVHVPAANIVSPGTATIQLRNPADDTGAGGGVSNSVAFNLLSSSASGVQIIVTRILGRDGSNNIVVQLTLANTGSTSASNVVLIGVRIGTVSGTPLPQTIGTLLPNSSTQVAVTVPASAGSPATASSLTITGTYTGGAFTSTARITLP